MEAIAAVGVAMASTYKAAEQLAEGSERLAQIFQGAGAQLQEVVGDFSLNDTLSEDARSVAELLLAWREVGEGGVVFAQEMLRISGSMRDLVSQMKLERSQRLAEAERLQQAWAGADPRKRKWGLGLLARSGAKQEEETQRQKDQQDVVASCLETVMEQMEKVRLNGRRSVGDAVTQSRANAKALGERMMALRSRWRGGLHREGQQSSTLVRLLENFGSALEAAPEALQDAQEIEPQESELADPELRETEASPSAAGDTDGGPADEEIQPEQSNLPRSPPVTDLSQDACTDAPSAATILEASAETSCDLTDVDSKQTVDVEGATLTNQNCAMSAMVDDNAHGEIAEAGTPQPEELVGSVEAVDAVEPVPGECAEAEAEVKVDTVELEEHQEQGDTAEPEATASTELAEPVAPAESGEPVALQTSQGISEAAKNKQTCRVQEDIAHQEVENDLDEELRICEQQLLELEQKRAHARSLRKSASRESLDQGAEDSAALHAASADEKNDGHQLSRRLSELAGHALQGGCDHRAGAMEVYSHANTLLERLAAVMHSHSFGDPEEEVFQEDLCEQDRL